MSLNNKGQHKRTACMLPTSGWLAARLLSATELQFCLWGTSDWLLATVGYMAAMCTMDIHMYMYTEFGSYQTDMMSSCLVVMTSCTCNDITEKITHFIFIPKLSRSSQT